jgi:hypothetical protein
VGITSASTVAAVRTKSSTRQVAITSNSLANLIAGVRRNRSALISSVSSLAALAQTVSVGTSITIEGSPFAGLVLDAQFNNTPFEGLPNGLFDLIGDPDPQVVSGSPDNSPVLTGSPFY